MTQKYLSLALVFACAVCCARPAGSDAKKLVPLDPAMGARLAESGNGFGFELFRSLLGAEPERNIFISPTSVAMALSMTWHGAKGETRDAMARAMGIPGLGDDELKQASLSLLSALRSADPKVRLEIANSLWSRKGIPFAPEYIKTNKDYYSARVSELDFADPKSVAVINDWVKEKTQERITSIVSQLDPMDVLLLVNAVYFKGAWTEEFDKERTRAQDFYLASGRAKPHPMMRRRADYRYFAGEGFQLVRLPYGDGRFSMLVFLPERLEPEEPPRDAQGNVTSAHLARAVSDLAARLTPENWRRWQEAMTVMEGEVVLPRFKLEYEKSLNTALSAIGMEPAFDPRRADFSGMLPAEIDMAFFISEVLHKSFVEVNEEGTEAAAVTSVKMALTAMPMEEKTFAMVVDRPFLYAITDEVSGAVLFVGAVFEPKL